MLYFAYGSNMSFKQMKDRCPSSKFIKKGFLENYAFQYDGSSISWSGAAVANIVKSPESKVWGGIFKINEDNLAALDCYEGYHGTDRKNSYNRGEFIVKDVNGKIYKTIVYFRVGKPIGEPNEKYRTVLIKGAINCELPEDYIQNFIKEINSRPKQQIVPR